MRGAYSYSYGYVEMYAQLPGYVDLSYVGHGDKFWPAFWMFIHTSSGSCVTSHDEIDMMDQCCNAYSDTKTIGSGGGKWDGSCGINSLGWQTTTFNTTLCNSYHKYGFEWNSNYFTFYFDDKPYFYKPLTASLGSMKMVIDLQLDGTSNFNANAFAAGNNTSMTLDYFRYYKLRHDCSSSTTLLTNTDITNFVHAVKSDIFLGNSSSNISLNNTDKRYYRAVTSITVDGNFEVPLGAEFGLIPTPCD